MNIDLVLASDHRGLELKEHITKWVVPIDDTEVRSNITMFHDVGTYTPDSVDYPDIVKLFASEMETFNRGILVCGSGMGMSMAANKHKKIRAAMCYSIKNTKLSRLHNNANIITLGSRLTKKNTAFKCIEAFINTKFEGGRHKKRVKKI